MRSTSTVKQTKNIFICACVKKYHRKLEPRDLPVQSAHKVPLETVNYTFFFLYQQKIIKKSEFVRGGRDRYKKRHSRAHKYLTVESAHKFRLRTLNEHVKLLKHNYSFLNNTLALCGRAALALCGRAALALCGRAAIITAKAQYLVHSIVKEII